MKVELKIPQIGESISEVQISKWLVADKEIVEKDQEVVEIDTDKTSMNLVAPASGMIAVHVKEGETVSIGMTIAQIETESLQNINRGDIEEENNKIDNKLQSETQKIDSNDVDVKDVKNEIVENESFQFVTSPLAKTLIKDNDINEQDLQHHILKYRIGVKDVEDYLNSINKKNIDDNSEHIEEKYSKKMSPLRKKLAQRLVSVKNETAMLTTFNEVDMSSLIEIRNKYKDDFLKTHGIKLGFVSFFAKAVSIAVKSYPEINAMIHDDEIIYHNACHIGIAVSTDKGLVVPVIRNVNAMCIAEIERGISLMAQRARESKLVPADLEGGTFTITNGGVFGSLLSTPIINPPQSAILGMHAIQDRVIAVHSEIVIRPMMYIALSYDHRLIDGKESVGFITTVKRLLENPEELVSNGTDIYKTQLLIK